MAAQLWRDGAAGAWEAALAGYSSVLAGPKGADKTKGFGRTLRVAERWFQQELPETLQQRGGDAQLSKEEMVQLTDWKLTRGKWRPKLLQYSQELPAGAAEAASKAAFALLAPHRGKLGGAPWEVVKAALEKMTVLKGTGPATASAALSAYDPSIPFLSDEAMLAALGSKEYTVKAVQQLTAALRSKAQQLSKGGGRQWTAREVERCLWGAALGGGAGASGSTQAGKTAAAAVAAEGAGSGKRGSVGEAAEAAEGGGAGGGKRRKR